MQDPPNIPAHMRREIVNVPKFIAFEIQLGDEISFPGETIDVTGDIPIITVNQNHKKSDVNITQRINFTKEIKIKQTMTPTKDKDIRYIICARVFSTSRNGSHFYTRAWVQINDNLGGVFHIDNIKNPPKAEFVSSHRQDLSGTLTNTILVCYEQLHNLQVP
jgi:hypothetical protein